MSTFAVYTKKMNGVDTFGVVNEIDKTLWAICDNKERAGIIANLLETNKVSNPYREKWNPIKGYGDPWKWDK